MWSSLFPSTQVPVNLVARAGGQGCSSSKHRSSPPRRMVINTFTPSLPTAASTSTTCSFNFHSSAPSESAFAAAELPGRSFREEMPDEWAKEWNERQRRAKEKREMEELRRQNELAIARQVVIRLWRSVCDLYPFPYSHFRSSTPFGMAPFPL